MGEQRRELKPGELFAIDPKYLQQTERGAFFWMFGSAVQNNDMHGGVAVVHVRDVLDHHEGWGDSYDAIVKRIQAALDGDSACKEWDAMAEWRGIDNMAKERPQPTPAKKIVLALDSPGGVVSGLNQTVEKLRRMCGDAGVPLIAFVNEKACSAAYALACACSEIYAPPSAIIGSIGVRSMMCDQTRADKKAGLTYVLIASGARKLDGDPHQPIADDAVKEEQGRVDYLANQFFSLVGKARGDRLTADKAKALQANVLIGKKALKAGLIDDVIGWDALLAKLTKETSGTQGQQKPLEKPKDSGNAGTTGTAGTSRHTPTEKPMRLTKKIKAVQAALASTTDAKKKATLRDELAQLRVDDAVLASAESLKKTKYKHETEVEETEEDGDPEEESEEESEEEAEDDDKDKDAEDDGDDKDAADDDKDKDAESEDDDKDAEGDDKDKDAEDEASDEEAIAALTSHLKGKAKDAAAGRLAAMFGKSRAFDALQPQVEKLKATETSRKRTALIDDALKSRRITKKHAKDLREKPLAFVKDFLKMHTKALYFTDAEALLPGHGGADAATSRIPDVVMQVIEQSSAAHSSDPKARDKYKAEAIKRWHETQNGARH